MSQENVEIAKDFYDAYNARNSDALDRLLHPEAEITTLSARGGLGGEWSRGTTRQYFEQLDEAWTGLRIEIEEYREVGERVVALGVARGAGTSSHVEVASDFAAVPDWHEVSALLHPDARFDQTRIPDGGVYEGREACGRFFERWFGTWDEIRLTPERFIEDGDRVLALMKIEGRGKGSGVPVVIHSADLFTVRDGKIASLVGYPDRAEALEAVGLSE